MTDVLQHGCWPAPMLQLPAIFLQQAISACVICAVGRHASAGAVIHAASKKRTTMVRTRAIPKDVIPSPAVG